MSQAPRTSLLSTVNTLLLDVLPTMIDIYLHTLKDTLIAVKNI